MQNVEYKAELRDLEAARAQARVLGGTRIRSMRQVDTYFRLMDGRLKRRETDGEPIEWIFYHRPDKTKSAISNYTILSDEQAKHRWGTQTLREWLTVTKTRELWMIDNVRIHLDDVDELGTYLEFEAVVSDEHDVDECFAMVAELQEMFQPILGEPISSGYSDLLRQHRAIEQADEPS